MSKKWRANHKEHMKEYLKKYYSENKERIRNQKIEHYNLNKTEILDKIKAYKKTEQSKRNIRVWRYKRSLESKGFIVTKISDAYFYEEGKRGFNTGIIETMKEFLQLNGYEIKGE